MFNLRKGSKVPQNDKLLEGYKCMPGVAIANVSAENIKAVFAEFIKNHNKEPLFFVLELPTNEEEETMEDGVFHKDVYYIDTCNEEKSNSIMELVGDILINDGLCSFGFGGHESNEEILLGKYNVMTLFARRPEKCVSVFENVGIERNDELVTAWDTFTKDAPGRSERVDTDGHSVFDLPKQLGQIGMYFAERREA